ncbi:DUF892 family protein [Mucilaginibacter kameinonensis]|uniref:DUF892 family protein n=1 Tax=Mucilaginibacter kameinonensis TaxID=452286 RepID=UPI000EF78D19|nr:DUF892 family protein [Mucilaginibacter kameinonensis]
MENLDKKLSLRQTRLTASQTKSLFITILSDIHSSKLALIESLPFFSSMAFAKDVKLLMLESATIINGQIIRVCLAKTLLGLSFSGKPPMLNGCLNLKEFLKEHVNAKCPETDAIILAHLIIAEGIEIDSFKILTGLSKSIKPKDISRLIALCYKEAKHSKNSLQAMLEFYS